MAREPKPKPLCADCGHWSPGTEQGLDDLSGYCDRWETIVPRTHGCEEFVTRAEYTRYQQELARDSEEFMDDD